MKQVTIIIFIFVSTYFFGQSSNNIISDDSIPKRFKSFLNTICEEESDTLIFSMDSLTKYKVIYSIQGYFTNDRFKLMRLCNDKNIRSENYFAEVIQLKNVDDSLRNNNLSRSNRPIKTCLINHHWGEALEDSIIIESEPSTVASYICANEIRLLKDISKVSLFESNVDQRIFENPSVTSYKSGKYLIFDILMVTQIGNETDSGYLKTYYLERVE
jgi:hypothetical protein